MSTKIFAAWVGVALLVTGSIAAADGIRKTVTLNSGLPDVQTLEKALFPAEHSTWREARKQCDSGDEGCGSVIPKASVSTTQVTFARGSATLTEPSKEFLRRIGEALKKNSGNFDLLLVEGHTDATGSKEINKALSQKRAEAVKAFLASEFGITNVQTKGRADEALADKKNPGSELNRRVAFVVEK
jgi:outer membrane protein OmpA-like peptidoglycan-associated protein